MGAIFAMILGLPVAIFSMIFSPVIGFFTGEDGAEIILPYDESSGLVWEYDDYQDVYVKLTDMRIENGKQIFAFQRNYLVFDEGNGGMATDLVFTDKNGNSETYYIVCENGGFGMSVLAPGEYAVYNHVAKAENPVKDAYWLRAYNDSLIAELLLYQPIEKGEEAEFTLVHSLEDEYIGAQRAMSFIYKTKKYGGETHEEEKLIYRVNEDGTFTVIKLNEK